MILFDSLYQDLALGRLGVEFAKEGVLSRGKRAYEYDGFPAAVNDLFTVELVTFEFLGCRVEIVDDQFTLVSAGTIISEG